MNKIFVNYFHLIRIKQYIKNLFVFAPIFFSFSFELEPVLRSLIGFVLFSTTASSIYIFNDLKDLEEDKKHPTKKFRPIASGEISKRNAYIFFLFLAFFSLIASLSYSIFILGDFEFFGVILSYFVLNIVYSLRLKHISIVDIFIIASGFVLRLFAGSSVTKIHLSMWIVLMTFLLALFLAVAKRREDVILASIGKETRKNIKGYNLEFVNAIMVFMAAVISVAYIQYILSDTVLLRFNSKYIYLTSIFVILGIIRYMQLTFVKGESGNPTKILLRDTFLQLTILIWLLSFIILIK